MKHFNRKIKSALAITFVCLIAFVGFSKAGIFFSESSNDVITVSTTKKSFDPNNYVASVAAITSKETTTSTTVTTTVKQTVKTTEETTTKTSELKTTWTGTILTKNKGSIIGPSGKETYYNLDMSGIVNAMRYLGFSETEYPYWVREDGAKMLGQYVMVAANYAIRPKGSKIESSLGWGIVCDTGSFVNNNPTQIDVAVNW